MEKLIQEFKADIASFEETTKKFYNKEITAKEYKGFSGGFGSYAQKGGEASMLRLRLPGGRLTKEKLGFIADMIEKHQVDTAHFTTCQTLQLHNLHTEALCDIMEKAMDVGIITRGGGGDFPRNTMVSPLSGVEEGECFDVFPYAEAIQEHLLSVIKTIKMPRKLKICFSNTAENVTHATFRDLGFVARNNGCFDVYSAGGLGNNPKMGVLVDENVAPEDILYYVQAMIELFCEYGNYENRAKARTRYMQDVLGENYKEAFQDKLRIVKQANGDDLKICPEIPVVKKTAEPKEELLNLPRIHVQKQRGLYAVEYHPIGGSPAPEKFREIYETIKDMEDVELRIAPEETVYIINLTAEEALKVHGITRDGAGNTFETSVSCIGAAICQQGVRDSQGLLKTIIEAARKEGFEDGVLPRVHISGCTSSCGTHQIGSIGFHGGVKLVDKKPVSAFTLHIGGCMVRGRECFGETLGMLTEEDVPKFLVEVGKSVTAFGGTYEDWLSENPEEIKKIAASYLA